MAAPRLNICYLMLAMVLSGGAETAYSATPPDLDLQTTYKVVAGQNTQYLSWIVCGRLPMTSGCFNFGQLGPFGAAGAMLEGLPATKGSVVTRRIYVLDTESGVAGNGVTLYVYKKVDTITPSSDSITITKVAQLKLPLLGGANARASMAANAGYVYIGTNLDTHVVQFIKNKSSASVVGGSSSGDTVTAIAVNSYGYVTVTWGTNSGSSGFSFFNPNGYIGDGGGGASFVLGTANAFIPSDLPLFP